MEPASYLARRLKQPQDVIASLQGEKHRVLAAVPAPLDELLPPVPSALDKAATQWRKRAEARWHCMRRCGNKLFWLVHSYGTGVLLLAEPIMRVGRLYRLRKDDYTVKPRYKNALGRQPKYASTYSYNEDILISRSIFVRYAVLGPGSHIVTVEVFVWIFL